MGDWIRDKLDPISQKTWISVLKDPSLFTQVAAQDWQNLFESWTGRMTEVQIWGRPLKTTEILLKAKANPLVTRLEELYLDSQEDTLVFGWHHEGGLLAATGQAPDPKGYKLPKIKTLIQTQTEAGRPCWIWFWDKRNFLLNT
jgi:hypothetical protein